jgi:hypothetical protein
MTFRKPIAGRTFLPDNAQVVSVATGQTTTNRNYKSELEAYKRDKEINAIMRQRSSVCG